MSKEIPTSKEDVILLEPNGNEEYEKEMVKERIKYSVSVLDKVFSERLDGGRYFNGEYEPEVVWSGEDLDEAIRVYREELDKNEKLGAQLRRKVIFEKYVNGRPERVDPLIENLEDYS